MSRIKRKGERRGHVHQRVWDNKIKHLQQRSLFGKGKRENFCNIL